MSVSTLLEWIDILHDQLRKAARLHSLGIITSDEYLRAVNEARNKARESTGLEPLTDMPSPVTVFSFPGVLSEDAVAKIKAQLSSLGLKSVFVIEEGSTLRRLEDI